MSFASGAGIAQYWPRRYGTVARCILEAAYRRLRYRTVRRFKTLAPTAGAHNGSGWLARNVGWLGYSALAGKWP
ncbi:MAG TPA: hypothetical protein VID72_10230, partial [Ktedonobacterales bacterium]